MKPGEALTQTTLPLGVAGWQQSWVSGAGLRESLLAAYTRVWAKAEDPAWIARISQEALQDRLAELEAQAAGCASPDVLLQRHPLWGVPFAVKDNIDVAGWPTTAACPAFARVAESSATVVQRLLQAGAVLMGKTNLDQFATGLVGTRSPYGQPSSTWDADRVSGGSSSGSAVVVARGDVAFALGTDTAGSGRVPAGFNHLVGLKPTPGRVSTAGVVPACRSLDCVSVFALTVADAAAVLAVIEGADEADIYSAFLPGAGALPHRASGTLRIGIPSEPLLDTALGYDSAWRQTLGLASGLQIEWVPLDMAPLQAVARLLYEGPWVAERHAVVDLLLAQQPEALDPTVSAVIGTATRFSAADAFRAQYRLREAAREANALWETVDLLMVPTAPRHPRFDEVAADPIGANAVLGTYTNFVNLLGWCALALPAAITSAGLPFGVTFIAPGGLDAALARFGQRWERAGGQAPGRCGAPAPGVGEAERAALPSLPWPQSRPTLPLAVVGAHLSGLPLNGQLLERGATLRESTSTAPVYRLFALPGTRPPKPGLQRVREGGQAIALEVWDMPQAALGSFLALIPSPLGLGTIELADGRQVHGFLCEAHALEGAADISHFGGWRRYLQSL
ncbi:MAG: allophanate hydrolase [Rubrivivax sp.]|nr:allophanate hydrolase [Rubrivivax sp.]